MVSSKNSLGSGDIEVLKSFLHENKNCEKRTSQKSSAHGSSMLLAIAQTSPVKGSAFRQVSMALLANLGTINTGLTFGFSAVAIPQMQSGDSRIQIDGDQASWIASFSSVGTPFGCILSAYLTDMIGRRRTLLLTEVPSIIGWLMIAMAPSIHWIYFGRILTGLGAGMVGSPSRIYTAEVTQPHLRGTLSALASVGASLGVALEYLLGSLFSWPVLAWISGSVPTIALVTTLLLPESPSWLVTSGQEEKCLNNLKKLRGSTCDVEREVKDLIAFSQRNNSCGYMSPKEKLRLLLKTSTIKPFLILTVYFFIYQFSGTNSLTFYCVKIIEDAGIQMDKYLATVFCGVIRLLFTIVGCCLMMRFGRRPLTFISTIGCGVTIIALGFCIYVMENSEGATTNPLGIIPLLTMLVFTAFSTVGYLIVPWVMIGELYPIKVRGLLGGMTTCLCHAYIFASVKTYPLLRDSWSKYAPFWLYGTLSLLGTVFLYFYLPETKGRTLQDIEERFTKKKSNIVKDRNLKPIPVIQLTAEAV